jgi:hypothetical protein
VKHFFAQLNEIRFNEKDDLEISKYKPASKDTRSIASIDGYIFYKPLSRILSTTLNLIVTFHSNLYIYICI